MVKPPQRGTMTLSRHEVVNEEVHAFTFTLDQPLRFTPGQYVNIRFPSTQRYHAFSIASSPATPETLQVLIKRHGEFTTRLFNSDDAVELEYLGPVGRFTPQARDKTLVCIAGGVGVAPFFSFLRGARDAHDERELWLFYSSRTRADIAFHDELVAAKEAENVHVVLTLTREEPAGWKGELGRVNVAMLKKHLGSFDEKTFFACGPEKLVDGMRELLAAEGVPEERLRHENWG